MPYLPCVVLNAWQALLLRLNKEVLIALSSLASIY
jgi:hypothetical protein